ncbi:MAG TPA: archease, partial [Thermoanaerobaculia bacterium]|nr:archease [Thermoanaerobaculia bacterium]
MSWHRWVDHTAEVQLQVGAESLAGLLAEAGRALGALLLRGRAAEPSGEPKTIEVSSVDREALLVDWLNEIIFLAEVERWVAVDFEVSEAAETHRKAS